jgi:hypothetical protein
MLSRLAYRTRQFCNALPGSRKRVKADALLPYLSPSQITIFRQMQPSEQAHACEMLEQLKVAGQTDPDLLAAALLHDVGKILYPYTLVDRVVIVLFKRFFQRKTGGWRQGTPGRLRRLFTAAALHPAWGADLAEQAGASPRTVELIRRHQEQPSGGDPLLAALQAVDEAN